MEYLMLGLAAAAMLIRDLLLSDELPASPLRVKIVYAVLAGYALYHVMEMKGWISGPTHYDFFIALFGDAAEGLVNYLTPEG